MEPDESAPLHEAPAADPRDAAKRAAALEAVAHVTGGMTIGLGTGSTARHVVAALGRRSQQGLRVRTVASSEASAAQARQLGLPVVGLDEVERLDLVIDGADEVDPSGGLIKGGGGALLREKVLASRATTFLVVVDRSKLVPVLGTGFAVPVEVIPFASPALERELRAQGLGPKRRLTKDGAPFLTDQGNWILDCQTGPLADARALADAFDHMVGLVEHGLFLDMNPVVIVGDR
jgi:ribose 5-phosphate isomerase A